MPFVVHNSRLSLALLLVLIFCAGCTSGAAASEAAEWTPATEDSSLYETYIVSPPSAGTLKTEATEVGGQPVGIACATCHGQGSDGSASIADRARAANVSGERSMHTELVLKHGDLQCLNCHDSESPDQLHSSAAESFSLQESMRLCSQCHGLIRKAYDHGAHGGMRGHWDLQRGPRERNTCIACHNPHSPAHPQIIPVAGPKDRRVYRQEHEGSMIEQRFGKDRHE